MLQWNWFVFACVYGVGEGVDGVVCPCPPVHNFIVTPHHLFALLLQNEAPRLLATVYRSSFFMFSPQELMMEF